MAIDAQLRNKGGFGLARFELPSLEEREDPFSWALGMSVSDQGPDRACGLNYLVWSEGLNLDRVWGLSHGCWNDVKCCLKSA